LQGEEDTLRVLTELGFAFVSSDLRNENDRAYTPLCHPWAVTTNDDDGFVIRRILEYTVEKGLHVVSYKQLYELVSTS
jgi:hypothetical protein